MYERLSAECAALEKELYVAQLARFRLHLRESGCSASFRKEFEKLEKANASKMPLSVLREIAQDVDVLLCCDWNISI